MPTIKFKKNIGLFLPLILYFMSSSRSIAIQTQPASPQASCAYAADNKIASIRDLTSIIAAFLKKVDETTRSQIGSTPGSQQALNQAFFQAVIGSEWSHYMTITESTNTTEAPASQDFSPQAFSPLPISDRNATDPFSHINSFTFSSRSYGRLSPHLSNYIRGILFHSFRMSRPEEVQTLLSNLIHGMISILNSLSLQSPSTTEADRSLGNQHRNYFLWKAFESSPQTLEAARRFFSTDNDLIGIQTAAPLFLEIKDEFTVARASRSNGTGSSDTPDDSDPEHKILSLFHWISLGHAERTEAPREDRPATSTTAPASTSSSETTGEAPGLPIRSFQGSLRNIEDLPPEIQARVQWLHDRFTRHLEWRIALRRVIASFYSDKRELLEGLATEGVIHLFEINLSNTPESIILEIFNKYRNNRTLWAVLLRKALAKSPHHPELLALSGDGPMTDRLREFMGYNRIYANMDPFPDQPVTDQDRENLEKLDENQREMLLSRAARPNLLARVRRILIDFGFDNFSRIQLLAHDLGDLSVKSGSAVSMVSQLLEEALPLFHNDPEITAIAFLRAAHFLTGYPVYKPFAPNRVAATRTPPLRLDFSLELDGTTSGYTSVTDMRHWPEDLQNLALHISRIQPPEALASRLSTLFNSVDSRLRVLTEASFHDSDMIQAARNTNALDAWNSLLRLIHENFAGKTAMMNLLVSTLRLTQQDPALVSIYQEAFRAANTRTEADRAPSTIQNPVTVITDIAPGITFRPEDNTLVLTRPSTEESRRPLPRTINSLPPLLADIIRAQSLSTTEVALVNLNRLLVDSIDHIPGPSSFARRAPERNELIVLNGRWSDFFREAGYRVNVLYDESSSDGSQRILVQISRR